MSDDDLFDDRDICPSCGHYDRLAGIGWCLDCREEKR